MSLEASDLAAARQFQQPHGAVRRTGDNVPAIWGESDSTHAGDVSLEAPGFSSRRLPQPRVRIESPPKNRVDFGNPIPVGAVLDASTLAAPRYLPQAHRFVPRAGDDILTIGGEGDSVSG